MQATALSLTARTLQAEVQRALGLTRHIRVNAGAHRATG